MQLQGAKISNKGQQDQQKHKHPKQQQQAEKSTRQLQSSAYTMGHGNLEEAPESFARPRPNTAFKSAQKLPRSPKTLPKASPDPPKIHRIPKIYEKIRMAIKSFFRDAKNLSKASQPLAQDRPRPFNKEFPCYRAPQVPETPLTRNFLVKPLENWPVLPLTRNSLLSP